MKRGPPIFPVMKFSVELIFSDASRVGAKFGASLGALLLRMVETVANSQWSGRESQPLSVESNQRAKRF